MSRNIEVGLVTCGALPGLAPDDRVLLAELRRRGISCEPLVWEDPYVDWSEASLSVIRSTWDYSFRRNQFVNWAARAARRTALYNTPELVRWNTHKRYLVDLAAEGAPVTPTLVLARHSAVDLSRLLDEQGWEHAVIKGAVAQTGRLLQRVHRSDLAAAERHLRRLLPHEDMLLQPFLAGVYETGECSLVFIDGRFTHAVRKTPASGDYRVHDDHGGTVSQAEPEAAELEAAVTALASLESQPLYARVDLVRDASGRPLVMELELVEPELFLRFSERATQRLADAVEARLAGLSA